MATIHELFQQGHHRLRRPVWNDRAYLRLDVYQRQGEELCYGPWGFVYDPAGQKVTGRVETPMTLLTEMNDALWEPYTGAIAPDDSKPE
jgi:hypothetical protein